MAELHLGGNDARALSLATGAAFLLLFLEPLGSLARDWWSDPDAAHGLLLFPIAMFLAWRSGFVTMPRPQRAVGIAILLAAVLLRYLSGLAAELFIMRASLIGALGGLLVYRYGWQQIARWWLPFALICLSVPLPVVLLNSLALPLQLKASAIGAALLRSRHVPVLLEGNVLHLPDRSLFVTEACSGLRSLTALIALGVLVGGMWLRTGWGRLVLVMTAIPVAMLVNSVRVFLTGFLVYYVSPRLADGFSHYTEGWLLFIVAFAALGGLAWILARVERGRPAVDETIKRLDIVSPAASPRGADDSLWAWSPTAILAIGCVLTLGISSSNRLPLQMPLAEALPREMGQLLGRDARMSEDERRVIGVTQYLLRSYGPEGTGAVHSTGPAGFSVYVGYYESQTEGRTIHSPKNCLPGSGWEALQSSTTSIETAGGTATVNQYLIQKGAEQALVLYWYQGRGRIQANEYAVKWNLLRDAAIRRRTEEALVRIVVPINRGVDDALAVARQSAGTLVGGLNRALPS